MKNHPAYDRAYREANRTRLNQKRRERRQANPAIRAKEAAYRSGNSEKISRYRKSNRDRRAAYKRAHRQAHPGEFIEYAHRTGRDLVRSGVLSLSVMRGGANAIADDQPSVLDELIAREEACGELLVP